MSLVGVAWLKWHVMASVCVAWISGCGIASVGVACPPWVCRTE